MATFNSVNDLLTLLSDEWKNVIDFSDVDFNNIINVLNKDKFYPKKQDIFNALNSCPPSKVKVVLIGQDPYINENEAHGFSFSVKNGVRIPPSLMNIFNELKNEFNLSRLPSSGCLTEWANEGVLLLNAVLTVKVNKSNSHKNIGWEKFTKKIIEYIDSKCDVVFLALGNNARDTCKVVTRNKVLHYGHPSPINTSGKKFLGCNCFRNVNDELIKIGILPVRWDIIF